MKRKVRVKRNLEKGGGRERRWKGFQVNAKPAFYLIGQRSSVASEVNYWNLRMSDIFVLWNHLNLKMPNICSVMIIIKMYFSKCQTFSFKCFHWNNHNMKISDIFCNTFLWNCLKLSQSKNVRYFFNHLCNCVKIWECLFVQFFTW